MTLSRKRAALRGAAALGLASTLGLAGLAGLAQAHGDKAERGEAHHRHMLASPMMQEILTDADADGDGAISREELGARTLALFDKVDADGNGTLSRREVREGFQGLIFRNADSDGDGMLSEAEFTAFGQKMRMRMRAAWHGGRDDHRGDDDGKRHGYRDGRWGKHHGRHPMAMLMRAAGMERAQVETATDRLFKRLDRDESGTIEAGEIQVEGPRKQG
ncbi:EF-hand domain-containing protein [Marivibrio halodurans]|uniref:EF-hand domain-containing protein n=1 Tax=Marivibrio halodurans TaxID=2039722 RepID=A0A8J7SLS7_9PROT|nr:EF-hand domain-containing protein [Marivibrio halodurans]MBP5856446.1 EF-hand domain-containing protein [Marivibrio halodurans]